ncbi:MAG: hydroxyethylthiazole kinase [Candidatus Diapherotrites archaeon]|nr:hydroxyethylthiazole kinase [Candidatus Diapherotrites archaeon]
MVHKIDFLNDCLKHFEYLDNNKPLVFTITNYVTILDVAQAIRDSNALPAMWFDKECAVELTEIASALYINMGTFDEKSYEGMRASARVANKRKIPIIVDIVATGASNKITNYTEKLIEEISPSVIKGNKGEISTLCKEKAEVRGVEAMSYSSRLVEAMEDYAEKNSCVMIASGEKDIVTDGKRTYLVGNGVQELSLIVGSGCVSSAIVACFVCCSKSLGFEPAYSSALAMAYFGLAGEFAKSDLQRNNQTFNAEVSLVPSYSFKTKLFDYLFYLSKSKSLLKSANFNIKVISKQ